MFIHMFPVEMNYCTAAFIGNLIYRFDRRHRERAFKHIHLSFPEWSEEKCYQVAKASMRSMVYLGMEFLLTSKLIKPERWRKHIRLANMSENLRLLLQNKCGMICLTGHFGNWEIVGYTMAALGFPTTAIARRMDNPHLDHFVMDERQSMGLTILDKRGATSVAPDVLSAKGSVSFIADQDAGRKGLFVDFFGRPASTYKAIALLAMQQDVPVIIGYGMRLEESFKFEIGIQRIIHPDEWKDQDDPMLFITQEYTTAIENIIRMAPEQYLWTHRRWKHRPKGAPPPDADGVA
ncbi:MAG: lysophospholipid acyltransferase family protein [Phycisphaerae bacterium]|nr:lysophospholipid acyltransferase family protein [Phycisphaerae bacterium]